MPIPCARAAIRTSSTKRSGSASPPGRCVHTSRSGGGRRWRSSGIPALELRRAPGRLIRPAQKRYSSASLTSTSSSPSGRWARLVVGEGGLDLAGVIGPPASTSACTTSTKSGLLVEDAPHAAPGLLGGDAHPEVEQWPGAPAGSGWPRGPSTRRAAAGRGREPGRAGRCRRGRAARRTAGTGCGRAR